MFWYVWSCYPIFYIVLHLTTPITFVVLKRWTIYILVFPKAVILIQLEKRQKKRDKVLCTEWGIVDICNENYNVVLFLVVQRICKSIGRDKFQNINTNIMFDVTWQFLVR
jgi:hypothetical protein